MDSLALLKNSLWKISKSYVDSHNVSLLRYISFAVDAGTTVGAKVMWDVLGRKAVFLHTSLVSYPKYLYLSGRP